MLFTRPISDLDHKDIEEFCHKFREDVRVEYKSTFDDNVKHKIPRVVSAFANSYGGVLVVGVNAPAGIPASPFEGIDFSDPEPRLTVENICRSHIFPEVRYSSKLVSSAVSGKSFLVIQVEESAKAPHAIENSTKVYVRTGDGVHRTVLADLHLIERLILRRKDVLARWNEFYGESDRLAEVVGFGRNRPLLELRIGPLYPTETVIPREKVFSFLSNYQMQQSIQLHLNPAFRHPTGALLARSDLSIRYLNVGEMGVLHYLEPLATAPEKISVDDESGNRKWDEMQLYPFWWIATPILKIVNIAATLMITHCVACDLRIEAALRNVSKIPFTLKLEQRSDIRPVSTLSATIPASLTEHTEGLKERTQDIAVELLYQLRWPLGTQEPDTREQIHTIMRKLFPDPVAARQSAL